MALRLKRTKTTGDIPVFQGSGGDIQLAQGGFQLNTSGLAAGAVLKAGIPMRFDEATRVATPITTGVITEAAGATATQYKVAKGSRLKVGDNFAARTGNKAYPITAIDTTNADYDVVTVGTTIGAVAVGDFVFASSTTGATNSSFGGVSGLLYSEVAVDSGETCSVVIRGTVYARRVPYSVDLAAALPLIIYSQSF